MISSNDLKPGLTIQQDGELYIVLDASQNKTARSAMVVKAKVRNLRSGANVEHDALVFMDNETYEQIEIPADHLEWERKFMKPNDNVNISMFEGEVLGVILPDKVTLQVTECEPAVKGDTATNALKNAVVETGLQVKVPLFISQDEMIVINTFDGKYSGRAK